MAVNHRVLRNLNMVLLCVTLMGLIFLAVFNKAQKLFIILVDLSFISGKFGNPFKFLGSCTGKADFDVSP